MSEENTLEQSNDAVQAESSVSGEPKGSVEGGESENKSSAKGEPGAEGLFDGMDAQTLHKSYKSLQGQFTKLNDQFKTLEKYGGASQMTQWAEYLQNNPRFVEWVKAEQARNVLGVDENDLTEDQKKAMDLVRKMASVEATNQIQRIVQEKVLPLSEAYKQQLLESHFKSLDEKYGKDWTEVKDVMAELSDALPIDKKDRPTFDDIEDLYFKALRKTGKFDSYAAKQYERKITQKKSKDTGRPAALSGTSTNSPKSIAESYAEAKRAMGLT